MGIVLDLILVGVLILIVAFSAKKGFIETVAGLAAFVVAVAIAAMAAKPVAEAAYQTFLSKPIQNEIQENIPDNFSLNYSEKAQIVMNNIPSFAKDYAEKAGLDISALTSQISKEGITNNADLAKNLESKIAKPITVLVLKSIMFLVLAIVLSIVLRIIAAMISKGIKDAPLVGTADAVVGALIGILKGTVVVFILCCLLTYVKPSIEDPNIAQAVNESTIVNFMENFSPTQAITSAEALFQNK